MTTLKDVAKYAHVSTGTVSNYINGTKPVSPQKVTQIENAINKLHYIPDNSAKTLKTGKSSEVGVILPTLHDQYYVDVFYGIQNFFSYTHSVNIYLTNDNPELEKVHINLLLSKKVAGIIIASCMPDNQEYFHHHLLPTNIPIVEIDRKIQGLKNDFISFDNKTSLHNITTQLLEKGYKNIFLLTGPSTYSSEKHAIRGYCNAFEEMNLKPDFSNIHSNCINKERAFKISLFLLSKHNVDAIIATSEALALGVCESLRLIPNKNNVMVFSLGQSTWNRHTKNHLFYSTDRSAISLGTKAAELLKAKLIPKDTERKFIILQDSNKFSIPEMNFRKDTKRSCINVLMLDNQLTKQISNLLPVFENETGIHVNIHTTSHKSILNELQKEEKTPSTDVFMFNISWLHSLVQNNVLYDLTSVINNDIDISIYLKNSIKYFGEYYGKIYGIPYMYSPQILYYRKDLFTNKNLCEEYKSKYNLSLRPPKTWKEFHTIAKFFTKKYNSSSPTQYGTIIPAAYNECLAPEFYTRLRFYNASIWDNDNIVNFQNKNIMKAYHDFINDINLLPDKFSSTNYVEAAQEFMNGNTAMIITYPSYAIDMIDIGKSNISNKIGYAPIPGKYSTLYGHSLGVNKNSTKKEAACKFISWLCGKSMAEYIALLSGQSIVSDILEDNHILTLYPWLKLFKENFKFSKPVITPYNHHSSINRSQIDNIICKYIYEVVFGNLSIEKASILTNHALKDLFYKKGFPQ